MNKTLIIAEAGVNHNGNIEIAKKLVDVAKDSGADIVKFQTFKTNDVVCKNMKKADYQKETSGSKESQYEMLKKLELSYDMHIELIEYCKKKNIELLSTPFDIKSIEFLDKLGFNTLKIPSGEITNYPYLKKIGESHKNVILSTGMSTLEEIRQAVNILKKYGTKNISILHCNTEYPTPMKDVNLKAINTIKNEFKVKVGYSDHTEGIEVPIAAVAMGAEIIEKHFTLDKNMEGPDHKASLEPYELKSMVKSIRNIELAMGNGIKEPSSSEKKNINIVRKFIVANKNIKKGQVFTEENLTTKRSGFGISPMEWVNVIGKKANKDYVEDEVITL
ncbi:N-acetylneuraminate synthase [Clostridium sp. HCP1S3_B4]|uniref:N-acetylneuraminate synthase n=1 Tax=unclassified Clostridium TaxID=2614128 RepID=UPI003F8CCC05